LTVLHNFTGGADGAGPLDGGLTIDQAGESLRDCQLWRRVWRGVQLWIRLRHRL